MAGRPGCRPWRRIDDDSRGRTSPSVFPAALLRPSLQYATSKLDLAQSLGKLRAVNDNAVAGVDCAACFWPGSGSASSLLSLLPKGEARLSSCITRCMYLAYGFELLQSPQHEQHV